MARIPKTPTSRLVARTPLARGMQPSAAYACQDQARVSNAGEPALESACVVMRAHARSTTTGEIAHRPRNERACAKIPRWSPQQMRQRPQKGLKNVRDARTSWRGARYWRRYGGRRSRPVGCENTGFPRRQSPVVCAFPAADSCALYVLAHGANAIVCGPSCELVLRPLHGWVQTARLASRRHEDTLIHGCAGNHAGTQSFRCSVLMWVLGLVVVLLEPSDGRR